GLAEQRGAREVLRADTAALFGGRQNEHEARGTRKLFRKRSCRQQDCRNPGLHVGSAAAEQPVAIGLALERVPGPFARAERYDVQMPGEAKWRLVARPAGARDHAGAAFGELEIIDAEPPLLEQPAGVTRA